MIASMIGRGKVIRPIRFSFRVFHMISQNFGYVKKRLKCLMPAHLLPKKPFLGE